MSRRYDICWREHGPVVEPHYCREWDESGGCYGTNPNHGYAWDEACAEVAAWHLSQADLWAVRPEPVSEDEAA